MYAYLDFYKQFQCIGTECLDSCCATGWQIPLDSRVSEYYQNLQGKFGDFLRENIEKDEKTGITSVRLTSGYRCPFLDEKGLCRVYIECGEEWMSDECQIFPRARYDKNGNSMRGFTVSCEEVLRLLYTKPDSVWLLTEGTTDARETENASFHELTRFTQWGMELLQDETVPFGVALAAVVHLSLEAEPYFKSRDYENFEAVLLQAPLVVEEFMQAGQAASSDFRGAAWNLIFGVTDTFCQIINEAEAFERDKFLWSKEVFDKNDAERRSFLLERWDGRKREQKQVTFMRRLAATFFQSHSMALEEEKAESLYLRDMCNYLILAEILPLTWEDVRPYGEHTYLSRLSHISTFFEQSGIVKQFIGPVIQDLFQPDIYSYAIAFMVLFGE